MVGEGGLGGWGSFFEEELAFQLEWTVDWWVDTKVTFAPGLNHSIIESNLRDRGSVVDATNQTMSLAPASTEQSRGLPERSDGRCVPPSPRRWRLYRQCSNLNPHVQPTSHIRFSRLTGGGRTAEVP
jgi:hypothetical protein